MSAAVSAAVDVKKGYFSPIGYYELGDSQINKARIEMIKNTFKRIANFGLYIANGVLSGANYSIASVSYGISGVKSVPTKVYDLFAGIFGSKKAQPANMEVFGS